MSLVAVHRALSPAADLGVDPKDPRSALYGVQGPLPFGTFMREARRQAMEHLARSLRGDVLAAEYALLTLLSRVGVRTEVRQGPALVSKRVGCSCRPMGCVESVLFSDSYPRSCVLDTLGSALGLAWLDGIDPLGVRIAIAFPPPPPTFILLPRAVLTMRITLTESGGLTLCQS